MNKNTLRKPTSAKTRQAIPVIHQSVLADEESWYPDIAISDRPTRDMRLMPCSPSSPGEEPAS